MKTLDISWPLLFKIWWSFTWRSSLVGMLLGGIAGGFAGLFSVYAGISDPETLGGIAGFLVSIPVSIWCMWVILTKQFKGYRVVVVDR